MREDWQRVWEQSFVPKAPPLLNGVREVWVVSENPRKLGRLQAWVDGHALVGGHGPLLVRSLAGGVEEPDWHNAVKVSQHKVVAGLHKKIDHSDDVLMAGNDVVVWINGEPYMNLSREQKVEPAREVRRLQRVFGEPSEVIWDVSLSVARGDRMRATVANRHTVWFHPIPADKLARAFWDDISGALGRCTRVPLIDTFSDYIIGHRTAPITRTLGRDDELSDPYLWSGLIRRANKGVVLPLEVLLTEIVTGFPEGRIEALEAVEPRRINGRGPQFLLI